MTNEQFLSIRKQIIERDFNNLNNKQKEAVFSTEGPLLVLAGAGSGKTTVLVNRIANLIKYGSAYNSTLINGSIGEEEERILLSATLNTDTDLSEIFHTLSVNPVNPWQVLAITFTNKAASELKSRIAAKLGEQAESVWAYTFHSACVRILRKNAEYIGFNSDFTIYDTDDSKRVIKECMKSLEISDKIIAPKSVLNEISNAKNSMISPEEYDSTNSSDYLKRNIGQIYKLYQQKLKTADAVDFDDIIYFTVKLFKENPVILEYYQNKNGGFLNLHVNVRDLCDAVLDSDFWDMATENSYSGADDLEDLLENATGDICLSIYVENENIFIVAGATLNEDSDTVTDICSAFGLDDPTENPSCTQVIDGIIDELDDYASMIYGF